MVLLFVLDKGSPGAAAKGTLAELADAARNQIGQLETALVTLDRISGVGSGGTATAEAIALVNDSDYGLSAGIWSENIHNCLEFGRRVEAGTVWSNTWMDGYPELAFGGFKQSGQGREIGRYGFEEFLEVKSLVMRVGRSRAPWVRQDA